MTGSGSSALRLFAVLAALLAALPAPRAEGSEADAAFARGDQEEALRLYERALETDPRDLHALFRSAQLHAWSRRFEASLERWDRLLALEPDNRAARLERAKTLSWAGRHAEATKAFRALLARDPGLREARLGLARTLSWSGRQRDARAEYEALLAKNPLDIDALVGVAQTRAWSGDLAGARTGYERVLALDPAQPAALLGLAYVELWSARHGEARRLIAQLRALDPVPPDLENLIEAESRARAPWLRVSFDSISDSDETEREIYALLWGRRLVRPVDIVLGAERHEARSPGLEASVTRLYGALTWRPSEAWRLYGRAGADRSETSSGDASTAAVGALALTRRLPRSGEAGAALTRDTLIYSPAITDAGIEIERISLHLELRPSTAWRARGELGAGRFSDDNERVDAALGLWRRWQRARITLEAGPVARWMEYADDLDNGYFDPSTFSSLLLEARARGEFGDGRSYVDAGLEGGWQSFTLGGTKVSGDGVFGGRALVGRWITERVALELYAAYSDYAVESAAGFDITQFGMRLRYRWLD